MVFLCLFPPSEHDHHAKCRAFLADGCGMIDSRTWHNLILKLVFLPSEWSLEDVE